MATRYDYVLAVWLRLESSAAATAVEAELEEHIQERFQITSLELIEDEEADEGELTFSMQLQISFNELQMADEEPLEGAVDEVADELRTHLGTRFSVISLEALDDALTSYLLGEWDDEDSADDEGAGS